MFIFNIVYGYCKISAFFNEKDSLVSLLGVVRGAHIKIGGSSLVGGSER